jgi:phosphoesterase RecJ-like protein
MGTDFSKAIEVLGKARRVLIVTHVNPEGDALGSLFGLALALKDAGRDVVAFTPEPVPEPFDFLPGSELAVHSLADVGDMDATFAVDCGQLERLGDEVAAFAGRGTLVNLDHHISNDNFGDVNIVIPSASAAGEILYDFLCAAGFSVSADVATNLYVAIHTDTGCFKYGSSTAGSLKKAGELVELGADPMEVSSKVYENYPAEKFKLLALVLSTLDVSEDGRIATVLVTREMLDSVGGDKGLSDGFVNYTREIKGVEVGILFREAGDSEYKLSMRSSKCVDVAAITGLFGGGGHAMAAGALVKGTLTEVREKIMTPVREALDKAC